MFDPKLKEALGRVQKPGRYTGGEPGSVYKDKEKVDVRFAFCFPLETAAWRVSDPYGWRKDPFTGEKAFHRGVDLACEEGTPVLAALDGVVTAARRGAAYGNYVRLTHGDGQETLYAHMQYLYVRAGEVVAAGQRLGTAGQTGRATGAHLHFEFLTGGIRYDPSAALSLP